MPNAKLDSTTRFSQRVEDYIRYRPNYPNELPQRLLELLDLSLPQRVADLGAGTGILTAQLAAAGFDVVAVEPNAPMCAAARAQLAEFAGVDVVEAPAEATGLQANRVDGVVAAQAFHWFDVSRLRAEVLRIGRPKLWAAMIWNTRQLDSSPFLRAYEAFAHAWGSDYAKVSARYADPEALDRFFGGRSWSRHCLPNAQALDRPGLQGRLASCSYLPGAGEPRHEAMRVAADELFDAHADAETGHVELRYDTEIFIGWLRGAPA